MTVPESAVAPSSASSEVWRVEGLPGDRVINVLAAYGLLTAIGGGWGGLTGCRPDVTLSWPDGAASSPVLAGITAMEAHEWLIGDWRPPPLLSPWNAGAGFGVGWTGGKLHRSATRSAAHQSIAATQTPRWAEYRDAIGVAGHLAAESGRLRWSKPQMITECWRALPAATEPWVTACALVLSGEQVLYSPLTGRTGGNVGAADLSRLYTEWLWNVLRGKPRSRAWLTELMTGIAQASLPAGTSAHLDTPTGHLNPWRWILACIGIAATGPATVPEFVDSSTHSVRHPWQTFMGTDPAGPGGYPEEPGRGEAWLPQPRDPITAARLQHLLSNWPDDTVPSPEGWAEAAPRLAAEFNADIRRWRWPDNRYGQQALPIVDSTIRPGDQPPPGSIEVLREQVRAAAAASTCEADFPDQLRRQGLRVIPHRHHTSRDVLAYRVRMPGTRPGPWVPAATLGTELTLKRLRSAWETGLTFPERDEARHRGRSAWIALEATRR